MSKDWHYTKNENNSARFTLGKLGKKNLFTIGINPSTAEPNNLDRTVSKVEKLANKHGYDGWMMLNVYPQRATNPNDLHDILDKTLHHQNLEAIRTLVGENHDFDIWAAWGNLIHKRPYLIDAIKDIAQELGHDKKWMHFHDLTKVGHPRHPLYLSISSLFNLFDIKKYLK